MTPSAWKYVLASVAGTAHERRGLACQDKSACDILESPDGSPVLVAVAADGAGSAECADVGASIACSLFLGEIRSLCQGEGGVREITREFVELWLKRFHDEVKQQAEADGLPVRQYACTFLAAVVASDCAVFFQIGDGAIVISSSEEPEEYSWVFWPRRGEYENITTFATEEAAQTNLDYEFVNRRIEEVAIFTDGLQHLALQYETRVAFAPFFRSMFTPLRPAYGGHLEELSSSLAAFLNSRQVNSRTDDDKTLVLATKRSPASPMPGADEVHESKDEATTL